MAHTSQAAQLTKGDLETLRNAILGSRQTERSDSSSSSLSAPSSRLNGNITSTKTPASATPSNSHGHVHGIGQPSSTGQHPHVSVSRLNSGLAQTEKNSVSSSSPRLVLVMLRQTQTPGSPLRLKGHTGSSGMTVQLFSTLDPRLNVRGLGIQVQES